MSLFKPGDIVYIGNKELTVESVHDKAILPVYQYSFVGTDLACACQVLSSTPNGPKYKLSDDYKTDKGDPTGLSQAKTIINTTAILQRQEIEDPLFGSSIFFKPSFEFVEWIKDYAKGRLIVDVGCGQGHLVRMLKKIGAKAFGIEPLFDYQKYMISKIIKGHNFDPNEILPYDVTRAKFIIDPPVDKLLIFARPCHSDFVEEGISYLPKGQEALYITVPENFDKYNDLGRYKDQAVLLDHKGRSEDNEVVYSIKK